jgi:hypothetical protein
MQPVPSTNTADEVRTLSLPGYPDGIWVTTRPTGPTTPNYG